MCFFRFRFSTVTVTPKDLIIDPDNIIDFSDNLMDTQDRMVTNFMQMDNEQITTVPDEINNDEDQSRSEATFRHVFTNISKLKVSLFHVTALIYQIVVQKKTHYFWCNL